MTSSRCVLDDQALEAGPDTITIGSDELQGARQGTAASPT
jgi:hypothetical protein